MPDAARQAGCATGRSRLAIFVLIGSVQGVVDFHWTALTMGILPDESLDAFFAFLAIFGL
jgi:ribose/xylose/arabinose/galactoside ABC-type transport system permease subunit